MCLLYERTAGAENAAGGEAVDYINAYSHTICEIPKFEQYAQSQASNANIVMTIMMAPPQARAAVGNHDDHAAASAVSRRIVSSAAFTKKAEREST
jgi:hypothetical protein